jgi:hypothetical protein
MADHNRSTRGGPHPLFQRLPAAPRDYRQLGSTNPGRKFRTRKPCSSRLDRERHLRAVFQETEIPAHGSLDDPALCPVLALPP